MQNLGDVFSSLSAAVGAADKVIELMLRKPTTPPSGALVPSDFAGKISFAGVSFCYPARPNTQVLVGKGSFNCPYLRYPLTAVAATVHVEEAGVLRVEQLDARVGRRGHIKLRGHLPLQPPTRR